jgi:nitroreductase
MKKIIVQSVFLCLGLTFSSCEQAKENQTKEQEQIELQNKNKIVRKSNYPVTNLILQRWSARAMSGEKIAENQLMSLFEAARWAPSSYNNQPWRFIYVTKDDTNWQKMFDILVPFNQSWAKNSSALILVLSYNKYDHNNEPASSHSFDTGAAVENLALQGVSLGLVVHTMEGFDHKKARTEFNIPEDYSIEAMIAIGKPASKEVLPQELQEKEIPSNRKTVDELISRGVFGNWAAKK